MSSRKAKSTEESAASAKNAKLTPTVVCYDAMAVIVNEANPLKGLSKEQVEKIFTGEITDWSGVVDLANAKRRGPGKISIYTRNTSSGTYSDFKDLAMSKRDYAPGSQKMAGNEQIASEVAKNPDGIGYVGIAYMKTPGVKALAIDGRSASPSAVKSLNYAYGRQCFYYTNGAPSGKGKPFVDFTLSPAGQKIVEQVGFIPAK
jgi:phosphate transport system substrate-binding protein